MFFLSLILSLWHFYFLVYGFVLGKVYKFTFFFFESVCICFYVMCFLCIVNYWIVFCIGGGEEVCGSLLIFFIGLSLSSFLSPFPK